MKGCSFTNQCIQLIPGCQFTGIVCDRPNEKLYDILNWNTSNNYIDFVKLMTIEIALSLQSNKIAITMTS